MSYNGYKWYAGVPHCHTVASDGGLTLEQVIDKAKKNKLDFLMITDHNVNCDEFPKVDGKYQSITAEQVEAVFASVEGIGTVSLPKFPENVVAKEAEIKRTGIFNNEVKLCGITVIGETWGFSSSVAPQGAQLKLVDVDKKLKVDASDYLHTYIFVEKDNIWEITRRQKNYELTEDTVLYYGLYEPSEENFVDNIIITVYDGDDIVGCAVFSVFINNINIYYVVEGAVEFPKVEGKSQSITPEIVKAYAESVLS